MGVLRISLLGGVHVAHEALPFESKVTHSVQALLAYLVLQRHRSHSRDALAGLFWGDRRQAQARSCLSTALWRLRNILEPPGTGIQRGTYLVITPTDEIGFNQASDHWLDVATFEEQVGPVLAQTGDVITSAQAQRLQAALRLYAGELLEGFYDDWALRERERLRALYLDSLKRLMDYFRQQGTQAAYAEGLACGRLILQNDPLREDIHRQMMHLYLESGQRALAAKQYETCRDLLAAELAVPPHEETQMLYAQITLRDGSHLDKKHTSSQVAVTEEGAEPTELHRAMQQVQLAMQGLEEAREHLQRALQMAQQLSERSGKSL